MEILKIRHLVFVLFTSFAISGYAQTMDNRVQQISKEVESIYTSKLEARPYAYRNNCGVTQAIITIYHENGEVRKVTDIGTGDDDKASGSWHYEYYYKNGHLIFSSETKRYYNNEMNRQYREDIRQYFVENQLIKQIENGKTICPKKTFISKNDMRYGLKTITKTLDIGEIYKCPGL
ncbi:hypothetical protein C8J95_11267 [Elizabethkingia sp. YR214]|uniref:hypothetical protein n=1 Tax=Elizabethkingia sp. YR214 TaxID=2135667 RepID=UPI000D37EA50|nr:hypothetical protein [Elizabethkingia sp. YR214]PUB25900.1 hypothetical protein C8J95_11267 [Elizabethkingia sp. YR214]